MVTGDEVAGRGVIICDLTNLLPGQRRSLVIGLVAGGPEPDDALYLGCLRKSSNTSTFQVTCRVLDDMEAGEHEGPATLSHINKFLNLPRDITSCHIPIIVRLGAPVNPPEGVIKASPSKGRQHIPPGLD